MTGGERLRAALAGLVAGLAGGLFGVGGGIVLIPLLTGLFALTQHQAHGTSLAAIAATAVAGLVVYGAHGHVAWGTAAIIGLTSIAGARLGARLAARTSHAGLTRAFAVFVLAVAVRLLWKAPAPAGAPMFADAAGIALDLALGLAIGVLSGFLGVGGGILAVPALTLLVGMPQQTAQGTSLAVILVTAPFGAWEHSKHGNVVLRLVPMLGLGAAIGSVAASAVAQRLPHETLVRAFAVFLLVNAASTWVRAARSGRASSGESDGR